MGKAGVCWEKPLLGVTGMELNSDHISAISLLGGVWKHLLSLLFVLDVSLGHEKQLFQELA